MERFNLIEAARETEAEAQTEAAQRQVENRLRDLVRSALQAWEGFTLFHGGLRNYIARHKTLRLFLYVVLAAVVGAALVSSAYAIYKRVKLNNAESEYVSLREFGVSANSQDVATAHDRAECLWNCANAVDCLMVMYDSTDESGGCHLFQHTLFYYDLTPFQKNGSTLYVKSYELSGAHLGEDGYYYYLTLMAHKISLVELECQIFSDFFHLAVETNETSAIKVAQALYSDLDEKGPNSKIVLKQAEVISPVPSMDDDYDDVVVKHYISVGETVEFDVSSDMAGYGLCQGDPFNRAGGASFYRDLVHIRNAFQPPQNKEMLWRPEIATNRYFEEERSGPAF